MPTILVYWSEGRSREQKARVIDGIIDVMVAQGGARPEDVVVIFQDVEPGDMGRGKAVTSPPTPLHAASLTVERGEVPDTTGSE